MSHRSIDSSRLLGRIAELGEIGRDAGGRLVRLGDGHDAQMIAGIAPSAMIFVPSRGGISHNPKEFTADTELVAGANILLDVVCGLATGELPK
ncbi:acetylornithine deacetylase/succinyl-diaminopimelate desuccinylase-like protein [Rhizobium leguminosarum]|uniref:Acetylornithine deacetylase/succinyl-diaminopimelate desuccinylase-like protein n=1 Tax=Rhizobium leguminosarum TaxID=384 RepID=A0AAE2MG21_RHILE|nr:MULTISPECIES: M20/M25/M40 family metallo-hydrolase [Rhizobium]MBB4288768.1 acetylornithine deacetylase/succinyl-diaminopimelate desuccinylase-like protein [Rhizobium leguminosarum]MBB4295139.1 acetylornithine deacetylase/succinyl-diaminopimelate desuccinylase-like protein [Rhizobium leguminosarum]MBB4306532.1 acetylornithine deacetylase/succinyl-diaminopimelate desuccinylase-like protein [Rhizobium leguminosarum]MBB4417886.1 acetylornithine deacetylase/succinyl-diaminopimelate desuccinylase-